MSVQRGRILTWSFGNNSSFPGAFLYLVPRAKLKGKSQARTECLWMCSETSVKHKTRDTLSTLKSCLYCPV